MAKVKLADEKVDLRRGVDHIGICVPFVVYDKDGNFLMHKRSQNCRDEQGTWDNGGGAVEFGERLDDAVRREVVEEYGVEPSMVTYLKTHEVHRTNNGDPTHWIAITHGALIDNPEDAKNNDPHKIDEIGWFTTTKLPSPLHSACMKDLDAAKEAGLIK